MKPCSITLFLGLLFLPIAPILSQTDGWEVPDFSVHSPDVTSLGQYGEYPVDISTGVPKIDIPLYTVKSGSLELPISLSYHAGGIRVDQEASFVGLGWSLNAAGVVTRVIRDDPDEEVSNGFLARGNNLPDYNPIDDNFPYGTIGNDTDINGPLNTNYRTDKEPDLFNIHGVNLSGEFCLDNTLQFVSTDYSPLKYEVDFFNELIVVTDEKGITYRFGRSLENEEAFETSYIETSTHNRENGSPSLSQQMPYDSSYHLTEMISANRRDTIKFKYTSSLYRGSRYSSMTRYILTDLPFLKIVDAIGHNFDSTILSTSTTTIPNVRVLERILFKNGSIEFSTAKDRLDTGLPRITGFTVLNLKGDQLKRIQFENNHSFNRTASFDRINGMHIAVDDPRRKSLKLDGIKFYDGNNGFVNDYTFEYDMTPMPPRDTTPQDFWGYFNGESSTLIPTSFYINSVGGRPIYFGGNRDSNFNYMKAGILTKIHYPTGGHTVYGYEPHYYLEEGPAQGKTQKQRDISLFAINRLPSCPPDFLLGVPANNTLEFEVTEDLGAPSVFGKLTIMFSDYVLLNNDQYMAYRFTDLDNGDTYSFEHLPSDKANIKVINREQVRIRSGHRYRLEAMTNGVTGSNTSMCNSPWIESTLTYDYWEPAANIEEIVPTQAGGLRVKSILSYDSDNKPITKTEYTYGDASYGPNDVGVGSLITDPSKNFYYYPLLYYKFIDPFHLANLENVIWFTSNSQVGLGLNNGSPVDYGKVTEHTVSFGNPNVTNGKTEYYYSQTGRVVDLSYANPNRPYDRFVYPSWKKSTLDSVVYYKQTDNLGYLAVKKEEYRYTDLPEKRIKTLKMIEEEPDVYSVSGNIKQFLNPNRFYYYNFYVSVGRKINSRKIVKEYENGLNTLTSETDYFYSNLDHLQLTGTRSTTSTGKTTLTKLFYPDDIASRDYLGYKSLSPSEFSAIRKLQKPTPGNLSGQHRISEPIQVEITVSDSGGIVLSSTVQRTHYGEWPSGLVLPDSILSLKGEYDFPANPMEERVVYHGYDDHGNPTEVSQAGGPNIYYIWGYNKEYPIAKLENQAVADMTLPQLDIVSMVETASDADNDRTVDGHGPSGERIYTGQEGQLREALDALRAEFPNAQVTTYTYDPLIGMTSITDPRGYTIYYEYDDFNRLKEVRDEDGNLVADYGYHYRGQNQH